MKFKQTKKQQYINLIRGEKTKTGGGFSEIKSDEDRDKEKNVSVIKETISAPPSTPKIATKKKISEEKLKRFINFHI
jgi:hypothetical protein